MPHISEWVLGSLSANAPRTAGAASVVKASNTPGSLQVPVASLLQATLLLTWWRHFFYPFMQPGLSRAINS